MSINFLIDIIVALIVAGFIYWALTQFVHLIPGPPVIHQAINALLIVLVVAIILFYVVIPILHLLGGMAGNLHMLTPTR
jgi:hypothetical protein